MLLEAHSAAISAGDLAARLKAIELLVKIVPAGQPVKQLRTAGGRDPALEAHLNQLNGPKKP